MTNKAKRKSHPIKHFCTITRHRHKVILHCFKIGIGFQGLFHDLSKYSPTEFIQGARYYEGTRSPTELEREETGQSLAWMHHKGRNRHHFEYWNDVDPETKVYRSVPMPKRYVAEMFCDRIAASKIYKGKNYTDASPYEYFAQGRGKKIMHPDTVEIIERWLIILRDEGEKTAFKVIKKELKNK